VPAALLARNVESQLTGKGTTTAPSPQAPGASHNPGVPKPARTEALAGLLITQAMPVVIETDEEKRLIGLAALLRTQPGSVTRALAIAALRAWAVGRTVGTD
jgi:hypothetical protein